MKSKKLYQSYKKEKKEEFDKYVTNIKKNSPWDIYTVINTTLIRNPYNTEFPKKFFLEEYTTENKLILFFKTVIEYYISQIYYLVSYFISFTIYKRYYKKPKVKLNKHILIDVFFLVDNIIRDEKLHENYFDELYNTFDKYGQKYVFLPRLYGISKNPFKLIKFFKIINKDKRDFLFEFELLDIKDLFFVFIMILQYPFKTLRLLQKENSKIDLLFNNELIKDISSTNFNAFSRYITGKNISQLNINKIYSWSEFQVIDRSFNYGIRINNSNIKLIACQFYINYETYFNAYVDDIDYDMSSSPHEVLVNGKYYILDRKNIKYRIGVSLRYKKIFEFIGIKEEKNILLLGSYFEKDTSYMLKIVKDFNNLIFKNHPAVDIIKFGKLPENIKISNENIYKLFENAKLVISTGSGTLLEAVACGISVIVIASTNNLTVNPLIEYGKGKIWDIAFSKDDVKTCYNNLMNYRKNNIVEIKKIANWYKENFFVEPTEKNIIKAFELDT